MILVPGFVSHVELAWEEPRLAHFLGRLAAFSRAYSLRQARYGHVGSCRAAHHPLNSGWTTSEL